MAGARTHISLRFDDCPDDLTETDEGFEQGDCPSSRTPGDDTSLTPLLRIQKYAQSGDIFDRHWVPRVVQDIFRTAPADILTKELPDIMKVLTKVADDSLLKTDLLENIPSIAAQAIENSERVAALKDVIGDYLIPLVVRNLGCSDTGVDKKAQAALIQMIERGYVSKFQAEIKICPSLLALTKMESQLDVNTGTVMLMSKLAPLLGRDITERILLKRYSELCSSHLFYVRKLSASHFGHYCAIVGKEAFENTLLPCYLALCQDEMWGVRKSCAEVIMFISCVCPPELRKSLLASAFARLLQDECRWVRTSALQTLGAFISTFADPPLTSIGYNTSGDLAMFNQLGGEYQTDGYLNQLNPERIFFKEELLSISLTDLIGSEEQEGSNCDEVTDLDDGELNSDNRNVGSDTKNESKELATTDKKCLGPRIGRRVSIKKEPEQHEDDLLSYNEYNYWYISPPDVDIECLADVGSSARGDDRDESSEVFLTNQLEELYAAISLNDCSNSDDRPNESIQPSGDNKGDNLDNKSSDVSTVNSSTTIEIKEPPQNIVPQNLIDSFVSMAHLDVNFGENDMSFHCAYSLPAVVLTLGKENWPLLKDTIDVLSGHMSYKIRRTVASSLHEIALILGSEIATEHLAPLFEGFLKDLDEVRICTLNNLSNFLQLISPEKRALLLPQLREYFKVDNKCNWRLQEKLAEQLGECVQLYGRADIVKYIGFNAKLLLLHNVAAVRHAAMILIAKIVKQISEDHGLVSSFLSEIAELFGHSKKWKPRQTFALLCTEMFQQEAMDPEEFATVLLPHLLDLSWDTVANVRLVVARCIVKHIVNNGYFVEPENGHIKSLSNVLRRLQADKDRDVRMSAEFQPLYDDYTQ